MREQHTTDRRRLAPSRDGVLFISGYATSLRVERGHLQVRTGEGRSVAFGRFSRVSRPRLRRVVIYGRGGSTTWDALEWIEGIGASFAMISRDGRVVAASAEAGPNQPALRRAQVAAAESDVGVAIVRDLLGRKVEGQFGVLHAGFTNEGAVGTVQQMLDGITTANSIDAMLALEAKAASAYWGAWGDVVVRFARADERLVPDHWLAFGERQSSLSTSARKASTPAGAITNYLYALAEFECRLALLAVGLDPGLGWAHRDAPYRDSAALDLLEPIRPEVDEYAHGLLAARTFSRLEFVEARDGQVRLAPDLARSLARSTLTLWERSASVHAERVAKTLAQSSGTGVRVPGLKTRGSRGKGKSTLGRRNPGGRSRLAKLAGACRTCGVVVEDADRIHCPDCIPDFKTERTEKLVAAARSVLAEMRSSDVDPAQTDEAKAKRVATYKSRKAAARAWGKANPGPHDPVTYRTQVLPRLSAVTVPQMMTATGLTSGYCWKIRRGERVPHPMYWESLRRVVGDR
jgi:CRISPR-associated endonuclease Cas1